MPALAASALCFGLALLYHVALLRPHGGWLQVYSYRRSRSSQDSEVWRSLLPIERTWFYFLPIAYIWSALLAVTGIRTLVF